jgi:hypothetical protein
MSDGGHGKGGGQNSVIPYLMTMLKRGLGVGALVVLLASASGVSSAANATTASVCKPKLVFDVSTTIGEFSLSLNKGVGAFAQTKEGVSASINTGNSFNTAGVAYTGEFVAQAPRSGTAKKPVNGKWKLKATRKLPRSRNALVEESIFSQLIAHQGSPTVIFELRPPTIPGPVMILESTGGSLKFTDNGRSGVFTLVLQSQSYPSSQSDERASATGSWSCL